MAMTRTFSSDSEARTRLLGERLAAVAEPGDVVLLNGELGCGKTRFAQGAARGLGVERPVTSPTFGLLAVYDEGRLPLYHFDLYRLETVDDLESIDFFATIEGDGLSLIEWASLFPEAMPDDALELRFAREGDVADGGAATSEASPSFDDAANRRIVATAGGPRAERLLAAWEAAL